MVNREMVNEGDFDFSEYETFKPRIMSKKELAMLYAPELSEQGARHRLHAWITGNKKLMDALLTETDYNPNIRILSRKQVELIVQYLGEP